MEQDQSLYIVFVNFTKAFDTFGRTGLWQLLRKYGCPEKFTTMIESLHTGMMVNVMNGGEVSDTFTITNGVKQGVRTGSHTFLYISVCNAWRGFQRNGGRNLHPVTPEGRPLYSCTLRAKTKTTNILVRELLFADDSTLIADSAEEIQRIVDVFANASSKFGLNINIKKTEVMFQPNSTMTMEEDINVDKTTLNPCERIHDAELHKRMSFGRLRERLWNNHNVSIRVKGKIYRMYNFNCVYLFMKKI